MYYDEFADVLNYKWIVMYRRSGLSNLDPTGPTENHQSKHGKPPKPKLDQNPNLYNPPAVSCSHD